MAYHVIEFDEQCKTCKGTGLYIGMAEREGAAVVCRTCDGTGRHHVKIEYDDFEGRQPRADVKRVHACNPGFMLNADKQWGGMPFEDWDAGKPFPPKSENRACACPAWWYQTYNYDLKPDWDWCEWGAFSQCSHFKTKSECWKRWDEEQARTP